VLYSFTGAEDGAFPQSALVLDDAGNLYGTASARGAYNFGTVFKLDPSGKLSVLHTFTGIDGLDPYGDLFRDKNGNLFGTALSGGTPEGGECRHGCGVLFKIDPSGKYHILYVFPGGPPGGNPAGRLIRDNQGSFYGVGYVGGNLPCDYHYRGCGVIFKVDAARNETVLHAFGGYAKDGDSASDLIRDKDGNIYGTTGRGGDFTWGSVFKLEPNGNWDILYSFTGMADGTEPTSGVVRDPAGNFYGSTEFGGDPPCSYYYLGGCGVIFKLDPAGTETVLYTFTGDENRGAPVGPLLRDAMGNLYGVGFPIGGGCHGECGTVFKLDTAGNKTILHEFSGGKDGVTVGQIILDKAGNIYGTAVQGGKVNKHCYYGCGVIFKITP